MRPKCWRRGLHIPALLNTTRHGMMSVLPGKALFYRKNFLLSLGYIGSC